MKISFGVGRKQISILVIILFTLLSTTSAFLFSQNGPQNQTQSSKSQPQVLSTQTTAESPDTQSVKVVRVIDGDTVELETGQKVRYIGIDTPETVHPEKSIQCFGADASAKNKELVEGKQVQLEKDVSEIDKYGRLLRYVFIEDIFVNDFLVRQGYAYSSSYPPDIKYQPQLLEAQKEAQENQYGLWANCPLQKSDAQLPITSSTETNQTGCIIKGNISASGEKIYHTPGQRYYDKTVIDESKGEKWFCSEEDALDAGWRKSKI